MNGYPATLSEMLNLDDNHAEESLTVVEQCECFGKLRKGAYSVLPASFWRAAADEVLSTLPKAFDIPIGTVLSAAWTKYRELAKYSKSNDPSDSRYLVALAPHTIKSARDRHVDVLFNGEVVTTITFALEVRITLETAKVAIQNGRFMALHAGSFKVAGTLRCEGAKVIERASREYELPGKVSFGKGIPIIPLQGLSSGTGTGPQRILPA